VPPGLEQNHPTVLAALSDVITLGAQLGIELYPSVETPEQLLKRFHVDQPEEYEKIVRQLIEKAPAIKVAVADVEQAKADLEQANLDLRYTDVVAEIDGVVTGRNVNPGNNVQAGQNMMAVRAVRPPEVWIDANFKETQLADLRIGQRVRIEVDMYGSRQEFEGHISGFTMGTGETLALLPPQNATGNFVKIVQRLPVRIELDNYDPDQKPLFVGLSVVPYVYYKQPATGDHAGEILQPFRSLPQGRTAPTP
jgi:membrane fusion protein (multidrug efflux system)